MPVLAVTFDFWCTLFRDAHGEARQQIRIDAFADATGVAKDEADEALGVAWAEFERVHREEQRTLRPEDAVHIAADALGVVVDPSVVPDLADVFATAILVHSAEPVEGALEAVQATAAGTTLPAYPRSVESITCAEPIGHAPAAAGHE